MNYVYFLTYLHLSNSYNFNRVEGYIWEELGNHLIIFGYF